MILVTGAAGKTGLAIIGTLAAQNMAARALVRRKEQQTAVRAVGAVDVVVGDMQDADVLRVAMQDCRAVYHICPNMHPNEVAIGKTAIAAARETAVEHFVYHSVLHPQVEAMPHHWQKLRVEELLLTSGLAFTILQPAAYMQNIAGGWRAIIEEGVYRVPYALDASFTLVDLEDVAAATAVVLANPKSHIGASYELAGNQMLTPLQQAAAMAQILDRPVQAEQMPLPEWKRKALTAGFGAYQLDGLEKMFRYYDQHGFWGSGWTLERLLERPLVDFHAFLQRLLKSESL